MNNMVDKQLSTHHGAAWTLANTGHHAHIPAHLLHCRTCIFAETYPDKSMQVSFPGPHCTYRCLSAYKHRPCLLCGCTGTPVGNQALLFAGRHLGPDSALLLEELQLDSYSLGHEVGNNVVLFEM